MIGQPVQHTLLERLKLRQSRRRMFVLVVLIPVLAWFMVYMFIPIISVIVYSFTNAKMQYDSFKFVGLGNYIKMFTADPLISVALRNTVMAVVIILPSTLLLALALGAGLNAIGKRSRETFTFVYFLPSVIPMTPIALVWSWLYHPQYGLINAMLRGIGLPVQQFLQSSAQALVCICVVQIWYTFGYYAVILLAAMRGVSPDILEAADIDGASSLRKFFSITLPMIKPNVIFVSIMSTIGAFMLFTPVDVLTLGRGTPGTSTMVLMLKVKIDGIQLGDTGYASAISILLLVIILFVSLIQWILSKEGKREGRRA
ncbi:MAG: sugar ABC transporter permease [Candidatus Limiplasma sp.]|nr:sugar ABC transporter permease [Candidatus Limiplasma sp.]